MINDLVQTALTYPNIDPIWFEIPLPGLERSLPIRWYSLAYIGGIVVAWWYMMRLIAAPGAPLARRHVDDLVTWVTLGIIIGGRLVYVIFYDFPRYFGPEGNPADMIRLWEGGMSFHGGLIGVTLAVLIYCWRQQISFMRVMDYIACTIPFGLLFGRLANFINGELWGRVSDVPWAMVFPGAGDLPRHPSQLYEAILEGPVLFAILWWLFWRSDARHQPGRLAGSFLIGYGAFRFLVEFVRQPDAQLTAFTAATGLSMGQWLCVPMLIGGGWLLATARGRQVAAGARTP